MNVIVGLGYIPQHTLYAIAARTVTRAGARRGEEGRGAPRVSQGSTPAGYARIWSGLRIPAYVHTYVS